MPYAQVKFSAATNCVVIGIGFQEDLDEHKVRGCSGSRRVTRNLVRVADAITKQSDSVDYIPCIGDHLAAEPAWLGDLAMAIVDGTDLTFVDAQGRTCALDYSVAATQKRPNRKLVGVCFAILVVLVESTFVRR